MIRVRQYTYNKPNNNNIPNNIPTLTLQQTAVPLRGIYIYDIFI